MRSLFRWVFDCEEGRKVLAELKVFAQYDTADFINDEKLQAYMQGRRSVICEILKAMEEEK